MKTYREEQVERAQAFAREDASDASEPIRDWGMSQQDLTDLYRRVYREAQATRLREGLDMTCSVRWDDPFGGESCGKPSTNLGFTSTHVLCLCDRHAEQAMQSTRKGLAHWTVLPKGWF